MPTGAADRPGLVASGPAAIVSGMSNPAEAPDVAALLARVPERLAGDAVVLRPMQESDAAPLAAAFVADAELGRLLGSERDPSEAELRETIARRRGAGNPVVEWAIAAPGTEACVGSMLLHSVDARHLRAELGFYLIPSARGAGLGRRAVARALQCLFGELELERVELTTTPDNAALRHLALALGFTEEGTLRSRNLERGRRVDVVFLGLLRDEWPAG